MAHHITFRSRFRDHAHRTVVAAVFGVAASAGALSAQSMTPPNRDAPTGRTQTADQQVQHVLSRLTFGARSGDVEHVRTMGVDVWIAQQLDPARIPDTATQTWVKQFPALAMSGAEFAATYPSAAQLQRSMSTPDSARVREAVRALARASNEVAIARIGRAVSSERQLQEVMVDFWTNHFSVFIGKPQTRAYVAEYEREAIRPHVLGNFREMLGAVAKSPAMLTYLDQAQSVADSGRPTAMRPTSNRNNARRPNAGQATPPVANRARGINENYARELMELHTLGVDGGYTQQDVMEVARALTGWTLDRGLAQGGSFVFQRRTHDTGSKTILGHTFPAGRGQDEGERVLDLLAEHPSTARFLATKLVRHLVSDEPPESLIDRAAATFTKTRGDIREVVRTIITSDEFFSTDAYRAKVKTPFALVVSAVRALDGEADATPRTMQIVTRLGQPLYGRATPDGYPDTANEWINTGAILNRMNFGLSVGEGKLPGARLANWSVAKSLRNQPLEVQVDGLVRALLGGDVSTDTRDILQRGVNPLNSQSSRTDFPNLVGLAIGAPEFQRR